MAAEVVGCTDLARTALARWLAGTGLKLLELPFEMPELESHLLWQRSADSDQANRWLRERILALYR